jgi:hypothetical protein
MGLKMNKKEFQKFLDRDHGRCWHCGTSDATLIPQHRLGRGMGGSKSSIRNNPSNIITFCSQANGEIESDAVAQDRARNFGWKLSNFQDPKNILVFDAYDGNWYLLNDQYDRWLVA